jgi:SanA protein
MLQLLIAALLLLLVFSNYHIKRTTREYIYNSVEHVPANQTGLVLGTSRYLRGGGLNPYFQYRIEAAEKLFFREKIQYIIVSGDNARVSYNEPVHMQKALLEKGIPVERIYLDYAGFRTLDSIVRCKDVFGQNKVTVITQEFHAQRAVFIARHHGIQAVAYTAGDVAARRGMKVMVREWFAKVKAVLDIYLFHSKPRFLGEPIEIPHGRE